MSDNIQFDADQQQFKNRPGMSGGQRIPGMAAWLVKKGIITDEAKAKNALVGIVFLNIILTAFIIYYYVL